MNNKYLRSVALSMAGLIVGITFNPSLAVAASSCHYQIYSKIMDRAFAVCETNIGQTTCESRGTGDKSLEARKTKKARIMGTPKYSNEACPIEKAIGVCTLTNRAMYFLGGPIDKLTFGCQRMQGTWQTLNS